MKMDSIIQRKIAGRLSQIIWILLASVFSFTVKAQEVKLETKVDKREILIGDQISYQNKIQFNPQKFRVQLAPVPDTFNLFEVVDRKKVDTVVKQDELVLTQETTLIHFDSGVWYIPSQKFVITPLDGGNTYELLSDSIPILVNTIDADTSKPIKPIYDIIAAQRPWWEKWLYPVLGLIALVIIGGLIYYLIKKNKNKPTAPKVKKTYVAPWDAANRALQKLVDEELWLHGQEKQHHTKLTDIVRTYLEDALGLDCFEKTSQEIITAVKKSLQKKKYKKRGEELDKLRTIFWTADLVKFAKSKPTEQEHQRSNEQAFSFVESTATFLKQETKDPKNNTH